MKGGANNPQKINLKQCKTKYNIIRVRKKWQPANRIGEENWGYKEYNGEHLEVKQRNNNDKRKKSVILH